jgi:hypothetical protein
VRCSTQIIAKAPLIFEKRLNPTAVVGNHSPLLHVLENVVIGQCEEMVAVGFVPIGDGLRIIIAITPE